MKEVTERINVVEEGIKQYVKIIANRTLDIKNNDYISKKKTKLYVYDTAKDPKELSIDGDVTLSKYNTNKLKIQEPVRDKQNNTIKKYTSVKEKIKTITNLDKKIPDIEFSDKDKEILRKLELEHEKNIKNTASSAHSSITKACGKEHIHMNSVEKPKTKLLVRPKQCVNIEKSLLYLFTPIFIKLIYVSIILFMYYSCHLLPEKEKFLLQDCKE